MKYVIGTVLAILLSASPVLAQPAPPEHGSGTNEECAQYGCLYSQTQCHHARDGQRCDVAYGIATERLPDGPDGRAYITVLWPMVNDGYRYDPARRAAWERLAACESSGNWHISTGNGYYGGAQFALSTWRAYGGGEFASYPHHATPEEQITVAERVLWAGWGSAGPQGRGAWPGCLRKGQGAPYPPQ